MHIRNVVQVRPMSGQTLLGAASSGSRSPLVHLSACGRGKVGYLASLDSVELTEQAIDWLAGPPPVRVDGPHGKQVVLAGQPHEKRWILHLISDGDYTIDVSRALVGAANVADRYPAGGWSYRIEPAARGLRVHVRGPARDRLLVLE